uniref:RsmD family RNA methyltransferase n=1 Tax=Metamycoplasma salivarium TaxID=2124 RepID=UPI00101D1BE0|nr:RsmD family RNA methyltransferase [Metamycoplasma salivarium]
MWCCTNIPKRRWRKRCIIKKRRTKIFWKLWKYFQYRKYINYWRKLWCFKKPFGYRERERESSSHSDAYYDVIYIDPPYNTESAKDDGNHLADEKSDIAPSKFVYRDKFSRNGWLNMLNERLRLAKQL